MHHNMAALLQYGTLLPGLREEWPEGRHPAQPKATAQAIHAAVSDGRRRWNGIHCEGRLHGRREMILTVGAFLWRLKYEFVRGLRALLAHLADLAVPPNGNHIAGLGPQQG